jgi:membrane associated rhomboid family serine protease
MFFLIPIGHDELTLHSLPLATLGLMAVCIAVFSLTIGAMNDDEARAQARAPIVSQPGDERVHLDAAGNVVEAARAPTQGTVAAPQAPRDRTIAQRYGWVPARPGVGIVTHIFLHAGVVQLLLSLLFLWTAGVRLEEQWSRTVLLVGFALFGVLSALVYGAVASDSTEPLLGASGAVAGLMGAMLVCAGRSKTHFAYFVWLGLKPRVGTFEAPAYIMPPLWLVTQLGVQFFGMTLGLSLGGMSYAQWIAGFAFGAAAAFAMKKLRFEERVLHREPVTKIDPDDMPLVAFQSVERLVRPSIAQDRKLTAIAATLVGLDRTALRFELCAGGALDAATADVRAWTLGRLTRIDQGDAALLDGFAPSGAPAVVMAFVIEPRSVAAAPRAVVVDAALLKYAGILEGPVASPKEAFFRLVSQLNIALPGAAFAGDRGRVHAGTLPEFGTLRDFLARLEDAISVLKPRSKDGSCES